MLLNHVIGLFKNPEKEWKSIHGENCSVGKCYCSHVFFLAAIPPIAFFIGLSQVGWYAGTAALEKLTVANAATYAGLLYISILVGIFSMGAMIRWMSKTYDAEQSLPRCIGLAAYTITPLLIVGITGLYPALWLNMLVSLPALAYCVYLLFTGVPIMMEIPKEKGFLFSSAVLAACLIILITMMTATVILWDLGLGPKYAN